jgi:hypothetical protein
MQAIFELKMKLPIGDTAVACSAAGIVPQKKVMFNRRVSWLNSAPNV